MTPEKMVEAIIKNLPEKTGNPLEYWIDLVKNSGIDSKKMFSFGLKKNTASAWTSINCSRKSVPSC